MMASPKPIVPSPQPDPQVKVGRPSAVGDVADLLDPAQAVAGFVQAQRAMGATWGEAIGLAAAGFGMDAVAPLIQRKVDRIRNPRALVALIDSIAVGSPMVANGVLGDLIKAGRITPWLQGSFLSCHMGGRAWITSLPDGVVFQGNVNLQDCVSLTALPPDLKVRGTLCLANCAALDHVSGGLEVEGDLDLSGCSALKALPMGVQIAQGLNLQGCTALASLPEGLHVKAGLQMRDCTSLKTLPKGLYVGWNLMLRGCTSWDGRIPNDVHVGAFIHTDHRVTGITLAHWRRLYPHGGAPSIRQGT